jgi:hypothetical protein
MSSAKYGALFLTEKVCTRSDIEVHAFALLEALASVWFNGIHLGCSLAYRLTLYIPSKHCRSLAPGAAARPIFPQLEVLHLGGNDVADLVPLQLGRFPKLRSLFLQHNDLNSTTGSGCSFFNILLHSMMLLVFVLLLRVKPVHVCDQYHACRASLLLPFDTLAINYASPLKDSRAVAVGRFGMFLILGTGFCTPLEHTHGSYAWSLEALACVPSNGIPLRCSLSYRLTL